MDRADPDPTSNDLVWREEWGHAQASEYVLMIAAGAMAFASSFIPPAKAQWSGNPFDDAVRSGVRVESPDARKTLRAAGDGLFYGLMFFPIVDSLVVALPQNPEVAWQMVIMSGQSLAVSAFVAVFAERTAARERPYVGECRRETPGTEYDCSGNNPDEETQSFPSGHALMAFTGAGLMCVQHAYMPLYGGGVPDGIACGVGLTGATFMAATRVMADRHYLTDVLVGSALGLASGIALPVVVHYGREAVDGKKSLTPYVSGSEVGVRGEF